MSAQNKSKDLAFYKLPRRESAWPNGSTLVCGLLGPQFESQFGECREFAGTYFSFFCSEKSSCRMY